MIQIIYIYRFISLNGFTKIDIRTNVVWELKKTVVFIKLLQVRIMFSNHGDVQVVMTPRQKKTTPRQERDRHRTHHSDNGTFFDKGISVD